MSTFEKVGMGLVGVLMATTLVLPGRQTPAVIDKLLKGTARLFQATSGQAVTA